MKLTKGLERSYYLEVKCSIARFLLLSRNNQVFQKKKCTKNKGKIRVFEKLDCHLTIIGNS
jgi:hypothetical protein